MALAYARVSAEFPADPSAAIDTGAIDWDAGSAILTFGGAPLPPIGGLSTPLEAGVSGAAALFAKSFRRMHGQRALYATGLASGSRALALIAPSGAGKTTLLLEMLRRGWSTFGDEFLLVDRETLVAQAFPLGLAIREASLLLGGDARVADACAGGSATGVAPERTFHGIDIVETFGAPALAGPRPLTHLVLFERDGAAVPAMRRVPSSVAALRIMPHLFIDELALDDVWETVNSFSRLACYQLTAPDAACAADLLETLDAA